MKIISNIFLLLLLIEMLISCTDIINTEPNYIKELIEKKLTPDDSLSFLVFEGVDFGKVKVRTVSTLLINIGNSSVKDIINVYNIKSVDTKGLYQYEYPKGIPFNIAPGESFDDAIKIKAKFIADAFVTGFYYDTLIINNNPKYYIPVKAKVVY
jgi:hypothetical protein